MPSKPRCAFREGPRQCGRAGSGNPPLCPTHEAAVEAMSGPQDVQDVLDSFVGRLAEHGAELSQRLADGMRSLFDPPPNPKNGHKKTPPRRPHAPPAPRPEPEDPWAVLGFERAKPPTRAEVKARQRALAGIYHPDKGGSTRGMQRVNAAAKAILDEIG